MAYEPTDWKNREVERPRTFTMQDNSDGTITLIPAEGKVSEPGTPIMAANMNKIEKQLVVLDDRTINMYSLTDGPVARSLEDMGVTDLNDLIDSGIYTHKSPTMLNRAPGLMGMLDGSYVGDIVVVYNTPHGTLVQETIRTGNMDERAVTRQSRGFANGVWGTWLSDVVNSTSSTSTYQAASANAVKQVNDKVMGTGWVKLSVNGYGFAQEPGDFAQVRLLSNDIIQMRARFTGTLSAHSSVPFSIPASYTPMGVVVFRGLHYPSNLSWVNGTPFDCAIAENGSFTIAPSSASMPALNGKKIYVEVTYSKK